MSKPESKIVSATGICVLGDTPASKAVEIAMRNVALAAHANGEVDGKALRAAMQEARQNAKPVERR